MSRRVQQLQQPRASSRPASVGGVPRPTRTNSSNMLPPGTPRRATTSVGPNSVKLASEVSETNIQVVVRCRGRSQKEIDEATPVITTTSGPLTKNITVETSPVAAAAAASTFTTASNYNHGGGNTKTYPFDKVFGPEADQTMIFTEVAANMLDEVLAGYNCTIFAYGQTGTGKTYTMAGDVEPTPLMEPSNQAGIIPRVLHELFARLTAKGASPEFSVRASYVELYNEELRDLLAPEYKDSTGGSTIKIFDDAAKKGVIIQGLEEVGIPDVKAGLNILNKGTQRRQTAETKMNSVSSRSHSIFTLTVAVKDSSADSGEDLLRIGKFNLVDLAGSEAIGRSGAENKRAREAGMINQSLLTLGRVISALVDKSNHIPYRESKLTRLLQDSLGGRTKTCIVATVSPTRSNMEETISTLDYALRAKSIKNKPEVNSHLTKAGLLKEYLVEIERLKADLFATREKNGIWMDPENYKELQRCQARQKSDFDEARSRVTAIEVELKTRKAEFEKLTERFVKTDADLQQTRAAEEQLTGLLGQAKVDVERAVAELKQEQYVAAAFERGEERLDGVAGELKSVATDSIQDVGGLHDKVARIASVLDVNSNSTQRFGADLQPLFTALKGDLSVLHSVQAEFGSTIQSDMASYAERGAAQSQRHLSELDSSFRAFDTIATSLLSSTESASSTVADFAASILLIKDEVSSIVRSQAEADAERLAKFRSDLLAQQQTYLASVGSVLSSTAEIAEAVLLSARTIEASQAKTLESAKAQASSAAEGEIERLRAQNRRLTQLLLDKEAEGAKVRDDLILGLTNLITGVTDAQHSSLRSAIGRIQADNDEGLRDMQSFKSHHSQTMGEGSKAMESFSRDVMAKAEAFKDKKADGQQALAAVEKGLREGLGEYAEECEEVGPAYVKNVEGCCDLLAGQADELKVAMGAKAQQQAEAVTSLRTNSRESYERSSQRVRSGAEEIATLTSTLLDSHATSSQASAQAHASAKRKLDDISVAADEFFSSLQHDEPTGDTPQKRTWSLPSWERTQPREVLLRGFRRSPELTVSMTGSPLKRVRTGGSERTDADTSAVSVTSARSLGSRSNSLREDVLSPTTLEVPLPAPSRSRSQSPATAALEVPPQPASLPISRVSSRSSDEGALVGSMNGKRPVKKRIEASELRSHLSVLGEGGNVPRRARRVMK